jgi:hypothetical protein
LFTAIRGAPLCTWHALQFRISALSAMFRAVAALSCA